MKIFFNGRKIEVHENITAFELKKIFNYKGDICILNGFPLDKNYELKEGDNLFFINKGQMPDKEEIECLLTSRHTPGVHEKIKKASIGIAGLGGLGSNIAVSLARMGIGKLILVDFDVVEPSNLNRQQYFIEHIGMKKTQAIKAIIGNINPFVEVVTKDLYLDKNNVVKCFDDASIVAEALDNPINKAEIVNTILLDGEKTVVAASGMAGYFSSNLIKTKRVMKNFYMVGDLESEAKIGCGLMAPRTAIAANHQANMIIRILLGENDC
ncbi:sulfur carrier protein ThiS adenylyltransferase ThiF [Haloimpatiens massiliensis]|uniref:sulfur carrier protein ThiS adenylyltransferase ThiF n=1 Tax=Haloimpatiens massiliensis TaxID=1658110 RepID=UPI000C853F66|nr:sulfur carrier protein ThiS adenylyltransferase ThiF [Haloimpatiens massiliensis]